MIKQKHELLPWPNGTDLHQQETSAWHRLSAPPLSCYWSLGALPHHSRAVTLTSSTRPLLILWQQPKPKLAIISSNCSTEALKCQLQSRDWKNSFQILFLPSTVGVGMPASAAEAAAALRASSSCLCRCSSIDTRSAWTNAQKTIRLYPMCRKPLTSNMQAF